MGNSDNVIGYIEYLSDDGKIIGYVTPFTDVDKFRKEILKAAEVGMPITPVVFPDKMDKPLGLPRDIYWPGGFRKEKRQTYPYEIYQTNNRDFVFRNYAYAKTRIKAADYKLVYGDSLRSVWPDFHLSADRPRCGGPFRKAVAGNANRHCHAASDRHADKSRNSCAGRKRRGHQVH